MEYQLEYKLKELRMLLSWKIHYYMSKKRMMMIKKMMMVVIKMRMIMVIKMSKNLSLKMMVIKTSKSMRCLNLRKWGKLYNIHHMKICLNLLRNV